jgi:hypothetical protein
MTKVQIRFRFERPLDENQLQRLADAHAFYGIFHVRLNPSMDGVTVEYDASRLGPKEVESALAGAGIPVQPA